MGPKITLQTLVHIFTKYTVLTDFIDFIFHKVLECSVASQFRSVGMFSNHFITIFPQNAPVKNLKIGQYLAKIWTKVCDSLFWATLYIY